MICLAIVEDDAMYAEQISGFIEDYREEYRQDIEVTVFQDGEDIIENYRAVFDIILMDIQMRFMDGMTAARLVRERDQEVVIMFLTNMTSYAIRGYEVDALDYILKPVSYDRFAQKLTRAIERIRRKEAQYVLIPTAAGAQRIEAERIFYIESQGHTMTYHTKDGIFLSRGRLEDLEKQFSQYGFYRSNKGYLVNMHRVSSVQEGCCVVGGDLLPISRRKKNEFMERLIEIL